MIYTIKNEDKILEMSLSKKNEVEFYISDNTISLTEQNIYDIIGVLHSMKTKMKKGDN